MAKVELDDDEIDIIETIRNIKRAYPNGFLQLMKALEMMIEEYIEKD